MFLTQPLNCNHVAFAYILFLEEFPHPFAVAEKITRLPISAVYANISLYGFHKTFNYQFEFPSDPFLPCGPPITLLWEEVMVTTQVDVAIG